jgi:choline-sulfatase
MMAGELPTSCGCWTYGMDLDPGYQTFSRQFAEQGYRTTCAGKLHHRGFDQMQGWRRRIGYDSFVGGPGYDGDPKETGFEQADGAIDRYADDGPAMASTNPVQEAGAGRSEQVSRDEYTVQGAKQFVREHFVSPYQSYGGPSDRPLLFKVSLEQPHPPFLTYEDRFEYYLNRVEPYLVESAEHPLTDYRGATTRRVGVDVTAREVRRATAAYYGMIETIDRQFGAVIDALTAAGEDMDEWIIVFTSDHGELLGQEGLWGKRSFHEGSVNVPLFVRWPDRFDPTTVDANVSLCDLYATLCTLADIPVPDELESRDFSALLEGRSEAWQEQWDNEALAELDGERLMIKRDDWKYVYDTVSEDEFLFDSSTGGHSNRIGEVSSSVRTAFRDRRDALGYGASGDPTKNRTGYRTA